jgi:AraC-like DNA-binding protein
MLEPRATLAALGYAAAIALGLLVAALLLANQRGNRPANRWLAAFVTALALLTVGDLLIETRWLVRVPQLAFTTDWLILALGPCMWVYVRRMTGDFRPTGWWLALHFVPMLVLLGVLTPLYVLPVDVKANVIADAIRTDEHGVQWGLAVPALHVLAYWAAAVQTLAAYRRRATAEIASLDRIGFEWLRVMLIVTLTIWVSWLLGLVLNVPAARPLNDLAVPAGLYALAFFALRQPAVFVHWALSTSTGEPLPAELPAAAPQPEPAVPVATKYARSRLEIAEVERYRVRLEEVMSVEKPWLENELTLAELARRVDCTPHSLSQLLNDVVGVPFFDYVNRRRVEEVKRCLADPAYDAQPVLDVALDAGFNSKATFNAVFRKWAGCTPSEYRRTRDEGIRRTTSGQAERPRS